MTINEKICKRLWHLAYSSLQKLRDDNYGFRASEANTGTYDTLFGRDSLWILIFLLQTVELQPSPSFSGWVERAGADALRALGKYQGRVENDANEEQPGKIIHEFRERLDERLLKMGLGFVEGRLYSGFDQTFLFVSAYRQYSRLYPDNPVVSAVWRNVELALDWVGNYADGDGDGLYEYSRRNPANLPNQIWKDSFDSVTENGVDFPPHPIAWIEVQAYAYKAFRDAAALYAKRGMAHRASHFDSLSERVRREVNERFWMEGEGCFAIALDGNKQRIELVSSNSGHALWADLVLPERAEALVDRLMRPDVCTRYGLRTISSLAPSYAPFAYHRGCVWPFDNAVIALGLIERGFRKEAMRVIEGVCEALKIISGPIELYVVLEADVFLKPRVRSHEVLALRRRDQENRNQGWTAAALLLFAATLAQERFPNMKLC